MYLSDISTRFCNLAGIGGISIPCGFTSGPMPLPIGLQLLRRPFGEASLLRVAHPREQSTDWHNMATPPSASSSPSFREP